MHLFKDSDVIVEVENNDRVWIIPLSEKARKLLGSKPYLAVSPEHALDELDRHRLAIRLIA